MKLIIENAIDFANMVFEKGMLPIGNDIKSPVLRQSRVVKNGNLVTLTVLTDKGTVSITFGTSVEDTIELMCWAAAVEYFGVICESIGNWVPTLDDYKHLVAVQKDAVAKVFDNKYLQLFLLKTTGTHGRFQRSCIFHPVLSVSVLPKEVKVSPGRSFNSKEELFANIKPESKELVSLPIDKANSVGINDPIVSITHQTDIMTYDEMRGLTESVLPEAYHPYITDRTLRHSHHRTGIFSSYDLSDQFQVGGGQPYYYPGSMSYWASNSIVIFIDPDTKEIDRVEYFTEAFNDQVREQLLGTRRKRPMKDISIDQKMSELITDNPAFLDVGQNLPLTEEEVTKAVRVFRGLDLAHGNGFYDFDYLS